MDNVTGVFVAFLVAALPLAVLVAKIVDTVRNLLSSVAVPKVVWNLVALGVGVLVCLGWGYNLVATLAHAIPATSQSSSFDGTMGQIVTGMAVGAMAGFWHEKMDQWSSAAKASRAVAESNTTIAVSK